MDGQLESVGFKKKISQLLSISLVRYLERVQRDPIGTNEVVLSHTAYETYCSSCLFSLNAFFNLRLHMCYNIRLTFFLLRNSIYL